MGASCCSTRGSRSALLFPALCFFVMVWALACGDLAVLPWAVGVASFIVQTHVGCAGGAGTGGVGCGCRGDPADALRVPDQDRRRVARPCAPECGAAAAVALVCWAQPLYEQLFGDGRGNWTMLLERKARLGDGRPVRRRRYVASVLLSLLVVPPVDVRDLGDRKRAAVPAGIGPRTGGGRRAAGSGPRRGRPRPRQRRGLQRRRRDW